jgi:hypothetical protein
MRKHTRGHSRPKPPILPILGLAIALGCIPAVAHAAQKSDEGSPPPDKDPQSPEIVVYGQRGSVISDVAPLATVDSDTIAATGATSMSELLQIIKPLTQSSSGGEPIFLLNGQRTSGYQEIAALPPEAIDKVEVLPEPEALKFGYPPTRRVVNFITKRQFRQIEIKGSAGTTTDPGSTTANANLNVTRLHNDQRFTLALESRHTSSLLQSERNLLPDPDILFDGIGNITGPNLGEIDSSLSQAVGQIVTVAPVPEAEADRSSLGAYTGSANRPRLFDLGPYRTLVPHNDAWKVESVLSDRLGDTVSGSLNITAERSTDRSLSGLAPATLTVPQSNPFSPFAEDVVLHRYLVEVDPLHVRQTTTTLHGGGTLRGVTAGWKWDLTAAFDQKLVSGASELGIDLLAARSAIAAGANPFVPLDPSLLDDRLTDEARLRTRSADAKLVVTNTPVHLPAGDASVTATVEAERLSADSVTRGANPFDLSLARTRTEAGISIDLPVASRDEEVLAAIGDLSINASANVRRVGGFGSLFDSTMGVTWGPFEGVQLLFQDQHSGTAPDMEKLASPIVHVANVPIFDHLTGRTEVVDLTTGGNPDLEAERKHVWSIALNVKPFPQKDIRLSATFENTDIRDQTGDIYALPPELESLFPDRFIRNSEGRLVAVTFQPTNFYRERQRSLNMTISANGSIGPKPVAEAGENDPEDNRPHYYAGAGPKIHFSDRLQLRPGTPVLDLLGGDSVTGGGKPRITSYYYGGIGWLGTGVSIGGWYQRGVRVRSDNPAADLYFSSLFKLNVGAFISVHHFLSKQEWTRHMQLRLDIDNVTNARVHVHDRNGDVPNRLQPEFLDPTGRTAKLTLRKLF